MEVFILMHAQQGTKSITVFANEIEELATQCQFAERQYMKERAMKDAIISVRHVRRASPAGSLSKGPSTEDQIEGIESRVIEGKYSMRKLGKTKSDINGSQLQLFVDSGCKKTLIPLHLYQTEMGPLQPTKTRFRAYGTQTIQLHGEIATALQSENGARHTTTVYVVEGHQAEPLLEDSDAKALGTLAINKKGHHALPPDKDSCRSANSWNYRKHPSSRIQLHTTKEQTDTVSPEEHQGIKNLPGKHSAVFSGIGLLKK